MIPVSIEGVRRNFSISSVFMYSVTLIDENSQRIFIFGIERQEALPIVAELHDLPLPRLQAINVMVDTLKLLSCTLEEVRIEGLSMLPRSIIFAPVRCAGTMARLCESQC